MRVGTPGFVAQRLTEAREARGFGQTVLSELTGIKSQSISHYEQGRQSPSPEALAMLCETLGMPERYFTRPVSAAPLRGIFYRSLRASGRLARMKAERSLGWMREIRDYLSRHIDLPVPAIPDWPVSPSASGDADIERIAADCRRLFAAGNGPVSGMVTLAENLGCIVAVGLAAEDFEGVCSCHDGSAPYILLAQGACASQIRFDTAHELGHLVMHRGILAGSADPDTHRALERQADRFARAFLLPESALRGDMWAATLDALISLRGRWGWPVSAMIDRCGETGIFDPVQFRRAHMNLARRRFRENGPEELPPGESPQTAARCIRLLIEDGVRDRDTLVAELGLGAADIGRLTGLPPHYLSPNPAPEPAALRLRPSA